jgi:hypothetical protein
MRTLAIALTCCLAACGGETAPSSPADAATDSAMTADAAGQEKMICDALASRSACSGGAVACTADIKCIYGRLLLPAAAASYASCRSAPSCKSDDTCVAEAGRAVGGAAADKYTTDCMARLMACSNGFKDDWCSPAVFAYAGAGPAAQECLAKPCAEINTCMGTIPVVQQIAACK